MGPIPAVMMAVALCGAAGCSYGPDNKCSEGEYPVYSLDFESGGACVADGTAPLPGYAAYPAGRAPQVVGDEYDRWPLAPDYPWADEVDPQLRRR